MNWVSQKGRLGIEFFALLFVIAIYLYPTLRARNDLGATPLPPIFAPDLSLYLNVSNLVRVDDGEVINPYYRIPVPSEGSGYLKFRLAETWFGALNRLLRHQLPFSMVLWNSFWWGLLAVLALGVFRRFLPVDSTAIVAAGLGLLMIFNFGILKSLVLAWLHLPSLAAFEALNLPFMRAFIPIVPCAFLMGYLGLQMENLIRPKISCFIGMAVLQLLALAIFPYATLMMAGTTMIAVLPRIRIAVRPSWLTPLLFGLACALIDFAFVHHSSVSFYDNRASAIHFQPEVLPHLVGGNWLILVALTIFVALTSLAPEVKWPLVGLGATNAVLMLGDAVVPATTILLSHHSAHFVHFTAATMVVFLGTSILSVNRRRMRLGRLSLLMIIPLLLLNGVFLTVGTYRGFLTYNRELAGLSHVVRSLDHQKGDLLVARSRDVDDPCGWIVLLSDAPVLFCTDAEVMLTPPQNRQIHHFRQALYLYFTGKDSDSLRRALSGGDPTNVMYRLGYWAEAVSPSAAERAAGVRSIETELLPLLTRVENHDPAAASFFRGYRRIVVIDTSQKPTFVPEKLAELLNLEHQQRLNDWLISFYSAK